MTRLVVVSCACIAWTIACGRLNYEPSPDGAVGPDASDDASADASAGDASTDAVTADGGLPSAEFIAYDQLALHFPAPLSVVPDPSLFLITPAEPAGMEVVAVAQRDPMTLVLTLSQNHLPLAYRVTVGAMVCDAVGTRSRVLFMTSETGSGDLGSWASASSGLTGIEAGHSICRNLAAARGFVGTFVAALSTGATESRCAINGATGTAPDCYAGGVETAGPWINTAGEPVTRSVAAGLIGELIFDAGYDETGAASPTPYVWTGTLGNGMWADGNRCSEWLSNDVSGHGMIGYANAGVRPFGSYTYSGCSSASSLLCVHRDADGFADVPSRSVTGKRVFVTSTTGPAALSGWAETDLDGVAGGDAICNVRAAAAGLVGTYVAWLSDSTTDAYCRLVGGTGTAPTCGGAIDAPGPWVTTRGALVAASASGFTRTPLGQTIHADETGATHQDDVVYTGTDSSGHATGLDCSDWTGGTETATIGMTEFAFLRTWTDANTRDCAVEGRIYCMQID